MTTPPLVEFVSSWFVGLENEFESCFVGGRVFDFILVLLCVGLLNITLLIIIKYIYSVGKVPMKLV